MSEKELKIQASQTLPNKKFIQSKFQKMMKPEKKKEELAFLPKISRLGDGLNFTLVVDLDETLVHYAEVCKEGNKQTDRGIDSRKT